MNRQRLILLWVVGLLLISACSEAGQTTEPTTTADEATTTTASSGSQLSAEPLPPPEIGSDLAGGDLLVAIEARWMCDVQRFAYSDLAAMKEALDERLALHGLNRADYDAFKVVLESQIGLRDQVLGEYEAYCGED